MGHTDGVDDDPTKFAIWTSEGNESEIFLLSASSEESKNEWVNALKNLLASQDAFAMGESNIIDFDKTLAVFFPRLFYSLLFLFLFELRSF